MRDVVETLAIGDIVDDDDAVSVAIVAVCYGSKPFLSGRVPLFHLTRTSTNLARSPLTLTVLVFWPKDQGTKSTPMVFRSFDWNLSY